MTSAWGNARPIRNDRVIGVGNDCSGAVECIELHVTAPDSRAACGTALIEAHMTYADAEWLIGQLQAALAERRAEAAQWA